MELDLHTQGYHSSNVDDFFRPLGSKVAMVKGTYSMKCYKESLESAFLDHCGRRGQLPEEVLRETDLFVLHAPFRNLPEISMLALLEKHLGMDADAAKTFLAERSFYDATDPVGDVGNIYTGAMYLGLAFLLQRQYQKYGDDIVGKNILMASYGSGNTMTVLSGRISPFAPSVIAGWDVERVLETGRTAGFHEYEQWINGPYYPTGMNLPRLDDPEHASQFLIDTIREDGYREYAYNPGVNAEQKSKTPVHMFKSA